MVRLLKDSRSRSVCLFGEKKKNIRKRVSSTRRKARSWLRSRFARFLANSMHSWSLGCLSSLLRRWVRHGAVGVRIVGFDRSPYLYQLQSRSSMLEGSCFHTSVCMFFAKQDGRVGLPRDSVMYVIVHKFLQFPVRRVVEAVGKAVSRQHSMLAGLLQSCSRCRRWLVVFSSYFFRNTPRYTLISRVEQCLNDREIQCTSWRSWIGSRSTNQKWRNDTRTPDLYSPQDTKWQTKNEKI